MNNFFKPIKTDKTNCVYRGPADMPDCGDLPVERTDQGVIVNWRVDCPEARKKILESGTIEITISSHWLPPMSIEVK